MIKKNENIHEYINNQLQMKGIDEIETIEVVDGYYLVVRNEDEMKLKELVMDLEMKILC